VAATTLTAIAVPAAASAAVSLQITPCSTCVPSSTSFPAGGNPSVTATVGLDASAGAPTSTTVQLAPGVLASANANPSCLTSKQYTPACTFGGGIVQLQGGSTIVLVAYLVPSTGPVNQNLAGVDVVPSGINTVLHGEISIKQLSNGLPVLLLNIDLSNFPNNVTATGLTLSINGTMNGNPLTRMPTNCGTPASPTQISVVYASQTETANASPDIAPTGCGSLAYAPQLTATATKDPGDSGVQIVTDLKQAAGEAGTSTAKLSIPGSVVQPNSVAATALLCSKPAPFTGCTAVGTASATSPLLSSPLTGSVYLTNGSSGIGLTIAFPAPFSFNLSGAVDLGNSAVNFTNVPDLPLTDLGITLAGGPQSAFITNCAATTGTVTGSFTGQNGGSANSNPTFSLTGCPAKTTTPHAVGAPTFSGASLSGLGKGKATLRFKLKAGSNAPKIKSFKIKLPGGLSFIKKTLAKGVSVSGHGTAVLSGGVLVVKLKTPASSVSVSISSKALKVSNGLSKNAKKHKVKSLKVTVPVTDAAGLTTQLILTFTKPS
jgi:hypothetical protein